ncbi:MAG: hypothetical protein AAF598_15040 [Bacteroidota bacterium]
MSLGNEEIKHLQQLLLHHDATTVELGLSMLKGNNDLIDDLYWCLVILSTIGVVPGSRIQSQILLRHERYSGRLKFDQRCMLIFQQHFQLRSKEENQHFLDHYRRIRTEVEPLLLSQEHYADFFKKALDCLNPEIESIRPAIERFFQLNILGNPGHAEVHYQYAEFMVKHGDPQRLAMAPIELFDKAASLGYQSERAYFRAGRYAHEKLKAFDTARDYYLKSQDPDHPDFSILYNLALLELEHYQHYEKAAQLLQQCLSLSPQAVDVLNNLAWIYAFHLGALELAEQYIDKALILDSAYPAALDTKGWIRWKEHLDKKNAERYFKKALSIQNDHWPSCKHLCELLLEAGKREEAKTQFVGFLQNLSPQRREEAEITEFFTYFR